MSHGRAFWRLNGCWILFRRHFRIQYWYLLLALRSSILKLNYLCNWKSLISEIQPCCSPLKLLSNSTGLTWFGFSKEKLCPISHNDLIMDWFSREKFYDFPRVIISYFSFEIDRKETNVRVLVENFYVAPIRCSERVLWIFSHDHLFEMKFRSLKKHYLPQIISPKILRTKLWNFLTNFLRISASHHMNFRLWNFVQKNL